MDSANQGRRTAGPGVTQRAFERVVLEGPGGIFQSKWGRQARTRNGKRPKAGGIQSSASHKATLPRRDPGRGQKKKTGGKLCSLKVSGQGCPEGRFRGKGDWEGWEKKMFRPRSGTREKDKGCDRPTLELKKQTERCQ